MEPNAWTTMVVVVPVAVVHVEAVTSFDATRSAAERICRQVCDEGFCMRSITLAGTASKVVALKTTAAVPMSWFTSLVSRDNNADQTEFLLKKKFFAVP